MPDDIQPKQAPSIGLPKGSSTCSVAVVDTTCDIVTPPEYLVEPSIPGHDYLNLPDYSFVITHNETGQKLLFDMGTRVDWENSVPHIVELLSAHVPGLRIKKDVTDILKEGGLNLADVKAFILSHWHFDHCGNISILPQSVDLIVGPGFKNEFLPGYPSNEKSPFWEADFKGRNVIEAPFNMKLGKYDAWDYFGDGSIYILNVPGHATGHISALVRTTPDTAIFMGGDVCHFTGDIRPTEYMPMPATIPDTAILDKRFKRPTLCSTFTACHPCHPDENKSRTTPYYKCASGPASFYHDPPTAMESIHSLMEFDADPNVLVLIAHDTGMADLLEPGSWYPKGSITDWKKEGLKEKLHWHFLNQFPTEYGKNPRERLCDGLYSSKGQKIKHWDGTEV